MNDPLEHKWLVNKIASKYAVTAGYYSSVDIYDLVQEGWLAVIKCIDKFNPDLGFKISTYLTRCIHTAIIDYLRGRSLFRRAKRWGGEKSNNYILHSEEFDSNKSNLVTHSPEMEIEGSQEAYRQVKDYIGAIEVRWLSKSTGKLHIKSQKYYDMKAYLYESESC